MVRKALMEYPNYGSKQSVQGAEPVDYERFIPNTSSKKTGGAEQKNNTSIGTSATYKNKELRMLLSP